MVGVFNLLFVVYSSISFNIWIDLCKYHYNQNTEQFHHPKVFTQRSYFKWVFGKKEIKRLNSNTGRNEKIMKKNIKTLNKIWRPEFFLRSVKPGMMLRPWACSLGSLPVERTGTMCTPKWKHHHPSWNTDYQTMGARVEGLSLFSIPSRSHDINPSES